MGEGGCEQEQKVSWRVPYSTSYANEKNIICSALLCFACFCRSKCINNLTFKLKFNVI